MQGVFQIKLTGSKEAASKFITFLKEHEEGTPLTGFSGWLSLPDGFTQMKPDQQTTIYIDPQSSGNITKFDYEEAFAQVAAVVPEMDMRATIRFFTNEEGEQVFLSPAGTSQMSDYYPIYCAGCGKEITNDEIFPDEEGVLYCQECAENGFGNDDEELEEDGWDEE